MEEAANVQEDLEDFGDENNLESESSFSKTLSDPTIVVPTSSRINRINSRNDSEQDLKNIEPLNEIKRQQHQQATSRSVGGESRPHTARKNELNELPITHVTLNLNVSNKKATSNIQWKHNFVRKKSSFSSSSNNNNNNRSSSNLAIQQVSVKRSSSAYSAKNTRDYLNSNLSTQSDFLETPDLINRPKSVVVKKSRDSSALSYHISDYKNFEHSRQSLTLQQQQQQRQQQQQQNSRQSTTPQQQHRSESTSRQFTYIDIIRSNNKSSTGESSSSICSSVEMLPGQQLQRQNYTVAEFNKFKNKLLRNHSRNYFIYDRANLNTNELRIKSGYLQHPISQPLFQLQPINQIPIPITTVNKQHISQIKSIYETIQRANIKKQSSTEQRRIAYFNSLKNSQDVLSNSLSVTKLH